MHDLEPHYLWLHLYQASEDAYSPFYEREYSEFEFTNSVYNHLIHPQWDEFGSNTLYIKILFSDYDKGFSIIEMIGEWNDCINNDIMNLKREVLELLMDSGINKFIFIGENVMNFHHSDDSYYEEWFQEVDDGWIALINFREHVLEEFRLGHLDYYLLFGGELDNLTWRNHTPIQLFRKVESIINKRLQSSIN